MAGEITSPSSAPSSDLHQISPCNCCCRSQIVSLSNIAHHLVTIKLTPTNYLFWRTQVTLFLEGQNLLGFVDSTHQCPPPTDPNHAQWVQQDHLISSLLIASFSEDVFPLIIGSKTSSDIWTALEKALSSSSSSSSNTPPQIQQQTTSTTIQSVNQGDLQGPSSRSTAMDTDLYEAVREGKLETIVEYKEQMLDQLTPNNNTVLHLTAQFHSSPSNVIDEIFRQQSSTFVKSLLIRKNSEGETALHIAARNGRDDVVAALIKHAKDLDEGDIETGGAGDGVAVEMLRMTNNYGDTALHEAVRHKNEDVVEVLVQKDPSFHHPSNDMGETPLYLAVESHYNHGHRLFRKLQTRGNPKPAYSSHKIVDLILNTCTSPGYNGPKNRTALHAAILGKCRECTRKVLTKMSYLTGAADAFGWTPLHFAALRNFRFVASKILQADNSVALLTADMDEKKTALHVAAICGRALVMKVILKHRSDCWEMVTSRGQNILHLAVINRRWVALKFILGNSWARNLINRKDADGNTPLHLYATSKWLGGRLLLRVQTADVNAFNRQNNTPLEVLRNSTKDYSRAENTIRNRLERKGGIGGARNVTIRDNSTYRAQKAVEMHVSENDAPVQLRNASETHLIVAALIATVTFAAGFTMPGGYNDNDGPDRGTAVLVKKTAFEAFIVTDTIAVICSVGAVTYHLMASSAVDSRIPRKFHRYAYYLIRASLIAMVLAFLTGVYVVITPSTALAVTILVIGGFILWFYSAITIRLVLELLGFVFPKRLKKVTIGTIE